jgi:hypothetical protein
MNIFDGIISAEYKAIFQDAIDTVVTQGGLATPCKLTYNTNINSSNDCDNCLIDPIYKKSMGKYNGSGIAPFPEGSICPICNGEGFQTPNNQEVVYMGVIATEKNWIDIGMDTTKIPNGAVQTICKSNLAQKIKNSYSLTITDSHGLNSNLQYERLSDVAYLGFGSHDYIVTMWKRLL